MAKTIMCAFGTDIDSVAGWIGSYGGGDSPSDIQRGIFATEVGVPRLLRLFKKYELKTDLEGVLPEVLPDLSNETPRPPIAPARLSIDDTIDWPAFTVWLSALLHARGDDIVRVKGVVRTPAGRLLLQAVRRVVQSPEILPEQGDTREDDILVVIGRGYTADQLRRSLKFFAGR
jgi:G3E family GTPase